MGRLRQLFSRGRNRRYALVAIAAVSAPGVIALVASSRPEGHDASSRAFTPALRAPAGGPSSHGASSPDAASSGPSVVTQIASGESVPVKVMPLTPENLPPRARPERAIRRTPPATGEPDGALQTTVPSRNAPSALSSFEGTGNFWGFIPPDVTGDVGPTQYVQAVNSQFTVFNKSGTVLSGPTDLQAIWASLPSGLCRSRNHNSLGPDNPGDGDPIVVYDRLADRWLITQFAWNDPNDYEECIAVSKTGDATGAYAIYDFKISTTLFDDYPKVGVWPDGYYFSFNDFAGDNFAGVSVVAFDRAKMLNGQAATGIQFTPATAILANAASLVPAHLDSRLSPAAGAPELFAGTIDPNELDLYSFHADFTTPANSTFTKTATLTTASFDPNICNFNPCIPQKGVGDKLDQLSDRPMQRLDYRNLGGSPNQERLVINQTVDTGANHAGIRWYELKRSGAAWSINQQSTYNPDSLHRWMGSMAMDGTGDIALGYSASSGLTFPSIRYTGRTPGETANTLEAETVLQAGGGSQQNDRWGDYTTMSVDPVDDCTFWYVGMYYAATSSVDWHTRIGSFRFPNCVGITTFSPAGGSTGTAVTVNGVGFDASSVVKFNGTSAVTTFVSPTKLTAVVPSGATTGRISVSTGTNSGVSATNFTVSGSTLPTISTFTPTSGITGSTITITGANLAGATGATFTGPNNTRLASPSLTPIDAAHLGAKVPNGTLAGNVQVTTPAGTATSPTSFTPTFTIKNFSPPGGAPGVVVTINGIGFTPTSVVKFNGVGASAFTFVSGGQVQATAPASFQTGSITVTNAASPAGTITSPKSFFGKPAITSYSPTHGPAGTTVTINGTSFLGTTSVKFHGVAATFTVNSSIKITAHVPATATTGTVTVTNPGGTATGPVFTVD
jgi:hypothetical protein